MSLPITEHLASYLDRLPFSMEVLADRAGGGVRRATLRTIPIYGFANGASGIDLTGDVIPDNEYALERTATADPRVVVGFRVVGQSMEGDLITDGSLVLCERVEDPRDIPNGAIVVAKVDDALYCKHWRRVGNTILLTSSSPGGKDLELHETAPAWVLRAVEVTRKLV